MIHGEPRNWLQANKDYNEETQSGNFEFANAQLIRTHRVASTE